MASYFPYLSPLVSLIGLWPWVWCCWWFLFSLRVTFSSEWALSSQRECFICLPPATAYCWLTHWDTAAVAGPDTRWSQYDGKNSYFCSFPFQKTRLQFKKKSHQCWNILVIILKKNKKLFIPRSCCLPWRWHSYVCMSLAAPSGASSGGRSKACSPALCPSVRSMPR